MIFKTSLVSEFSRVSKESPRPGDQPVINIIQQRKVVVIGRQFTFLPSFSLQLVFNKELYLTDVLRQECQLFNSIGLKQL